MVRWLTSASAALLTIVFGACGGGSNGGMSVTFGPSSITANYAQCDNPYTYGVTVSATLSSLPKESVYVYIVEDNLVLKDNQVTISSAGGNSFTGTVYPSPMLSPGTHQGVLTLRICKDPNCTQEYPLSGNTLPYIFTVASGKIVTAKIDGVAQSGISGVYCSQNIDANVGQTVELQSSVPVSWSYSIGTSAGVPEVTGLSTTTTTWTATVTSTSGTCGVHALVGDILVNATPEGTTWSDIPVNVNVWCP